MPRTFSKGNYSNVSNIQKIRIPNGSVNLQIKKNQFKSFSDYQPGDTTTIKAIVRIGEEDEDGLTTLHAQTFEAEAIDPGAKILRNMTGEIKPNMSGTNILFGINEEE